jgi:predicted transcriptional regulator of viral defense system
MPSASNFIENLQRRGRYHFSTEEAVKALGSSLSATQAALRRLKAKGEIAAPHRGFHVVLPPEYRGLGCLPAEDFIPQLMQHLGEPYYVALLSAAAYHGAAHQKPQRFQVMVSRRRRPIACGEVHVQFISRKDMVETPVALRNTPRGIIRIASEAATAHELVGYAEHAGGLNNVATVLAELAESLDAEALIAEARRVPLAWVQRLGYLLTLVGASDLAAALDPVVQARNPFPVALAPSTTTAGCPGDARWKVSINAQVEPDL